MSAVEPKSLFEQFFQATDEAWSVVALEPAASPRVDVARENRSFRLLAQDGGTAPLTDPFWIAELERVARTGAELRTCVRIDAARWVELHAFLLEDGSRPLLGLRLKDLREHRAATGQLICLRRIRTVGVLFWGAGFGLEDVNDGFVLMSGFSREEAIGRTWQELTPEEFHAQSWNAVRQVLTAGEAVPYEKQYFRKDGSRWWGLFAPRRVGEQVIEFVLDVTEQRRAEAALREADRRKDEFLATLAHELRNPLAPIKNGTQIMRLKLPRDAPVQRTLAIVDRQVDHLVRLVDDLLDIARITSGKVRIERQPVALREVLARSLDSIQPRLDAKAHRLLADMPPQDMHVLGDEDRLTQVFSNLLSNAVKYTPQGGEIRVAAVADASEAVVRVGDSGIGIPPAQQAGVFDLFSQVRDHQSHAEGGLGIGLALVRNLVHLHGGRVEVESPGVGQGSVFTVRLPLLRLSVAAPAPASTQRPTEPARRILVADDNGDAADTLAALLTAAGHEVITACNGLDALEKASDFKPELAFLDVGMPVMDGIEAARRMRAREDLKDMKLVALTGWGQSADRQRTAEAGFDLHLIKPLTAAGLAAALAAGSTQPGSTVAGTRPSRSGGDAEKR